jgi:carboxyl-terminal processing protease
MIIDVRTNSGGAELLARSIAGCFVDKPTVYSRNKSRDPSSPDGWTNVMDRTLTPTPDRPHFAGKLAVLIGKQCMSSNESFIAMLKHGASGGATLLGDSTYGSSGNPRPVDLCPNVRVVLPTWIDLLPDGATLEGKGIAPDIRIDWKPTPISDPILEAAAKHLKKN